MVRGEKKENIFKSNELFSVKSTYGSQYDYQIRNLQKKHKVRVLPHSNTATTQ